MKKDNFDLRSYLIENKMTENSRGDVRHQLGETILDTRILSEMQIPADPTDHHDPEYDDDWAAGEGADMADDYNDAQMDAGIDECGDLGGDMPLDETGDPNYDPMEHPEDWPKDYTQKLNRNNNRTAKRDTERIIKNNPGAARDFIDEAGYTDDDDDEWTDPDAIGDDDNGASLLDLVRGDKKAASARKAATKDSADDFDPTAGEPESFGDEPAVDPEDAEPSAGESDPNAEAQPGLSAQVKYNPNTVEMMMDDQELDQYLSGFRRPQVAVNVLNRAIRTAQDEVNDSIGLNHLYIVLENGFYVTSRTERGQVIAKVNADQEWRKKNFGED